MKKAGDDTDHATTKTASIICPRRGGGNAIAACSKPYVTTCDSKGDTSYRSRATLEVRNDGTLAYRIGEKAAQDSPCELP